MLVGGFQDVLTDKGRLTANCLVHDAAQRVDVRARIKLSAHALLRTHIKRTAEDFSRVSYVLIGFDVISFICQQFGNAEIHNPSQFLTASFLLDDDIARFQISVQNLFLVRILESFNRLKEKGKSLDLPPGDRSWTTNPQDSARLCNRKSSKPDRLSQDESHGN